MTAPRSLAEHFAPPPGFTGEFGWVCGFSADAAFLNEAANRFTGMGRAQREAGGDIRLALMLDPSQPALQPAVVAGLAHLPLRSVARKPFRLLHAKIALLGFRDEQAPDRWCVRLLVSTGNWTRQTVEDSLDLACRVEVCRETRGTKQQAQACADISAAYSLMQWLLALHDTRLLQAESALAGGHAAARVIQWLKDCGSGPCILGSEPRFVHSCQQALLSSIVKRVKGKGRRTFLAMGSGFFEAPNDGTGSQPVLPPAVPTEIVKQLRAAGYLRKKAIVELHVNPGACQAIAGAVTHLRNHPVQPISVHAAQAPESLYGRHCSRSLHAKFIFSGSRDSRTGAYRHAWLYLGSGNLTHAGMLLPMSPDGGNLEAGMVLFPEDLFHNGKRMPQHLLRERLPIGGPELTAESVGLSAGEAWQPSQVLHVAAPVAYLHWRTEGLLQPGRIEIALDGAQPAFEVLDEAGIPCALQGDSYTWLGAAPRVVRVRWQMDGRSHIVWIPVIDPDGRVAAAPLPVLDLGLAQEQLLAFPGMPEIAEEDDGERSDDGGVLNYRKKCRPYGKGGCSQGTAIRRMMGLLEQVAAQQTVLHAADWPRWCQRLQQTLMQASQSAEVSRFVAMGLDPLSPLRAAPFRPAFAEDVSSEAGQYYETVLDRVGCEWNTAGLRSLEDAT